MAQSVCEEPYVSVQDWSAKCDHVAAGQYAPAVEELKARTLCGSCGALL